MNNQCCYIVYLVGMYIYIAKNDTWTFQHQVHYISIENFILGDAYCRQFFDGGGVCNFIHKALKLSTINLHEFCKHKDSEVCTILLELSYTKILVITVYKLPASDFQLFLKILEVIIKKFFQSNLKLIICRDINVNYLIDTDRKRQLNSILNSYNLFSTIHFPTSNQNGSMKISSLKHSYFLISKLLQ